MPWMTTSSARHEKKGSSRQSISFQLLVQERMVVLRPALTGRALPQSRTSAQVAMEELHAILQISLSLSSNNGRTRPARVEEG